MSLAQFPHLPVTATPVQEEEVRVVVRRGPSVVSEAGPAGAAAAAAGVRISLKGHGEPWWVLEQGRGRET